MAGWLQRLWTKRRDGAVCSAVLAAAGSSSRMGGENKLFLPLGGIPVLARSILAFERAPSIAEIVVAAREEDLLAVGDLCRTFGVTKPVKIVRGGANRTESVLAACLECSPDSALIAEIEAALQQKREIAVDVEVCSPQEQTVDVTVAIQAAEGYTYDQAEDDADAALRAHFTGDLLGKGVTLAQLGHLLYSLESVSNYRFTSPTADVAASDTALPRLGDLTISIMEEET